MNKQCLKCIPNNTEIDCYQCYVISEYNKKSKKEFSSFLNFILFGLSVIAGFNIIDNLTFKCIDYGLSFGFFGLCLCFVIYCLPIKKKR